MGCSLSRSPRRVRSRPGARQRLTSQQEAAVAAVFAAATAALSQAHASPAAMVSEKLSPAEDAAAVPDATTGVAPEDDPEVSQTVEQQYVFHQLIGRGQFGFVYRATDRKTNVDYAIKKIDRRRSKPEYVEAEIMILCRIGSHPNVISLHEAYQTSDHIFLVLELMRGGELFDLLNESPYSEADARIAVHGMTSAVAYMHANGIVHRDIKPENLLLSEPTTKGNVKLSDFGLSKFLEPGQSLNAVCGTWAYSAPEMRHPARPGYGFQVDAWSVGVLVYIMLGGYHPFDPEGGADQASILAAIQTGIFDFLDPVWESVSEVAKDLICRLLVVDPMQRLTAAQALQHEWFTTQTVSTVPIANTEHLAEFNASMRKKLRTAMLSTLAGVRMRRAAARRRRRFSDPVHDGGSAAFSMPGRVSAALSGGAGAAAAIDETLAGQARTRLGTHSPQASPSSAAEASASGAAHTGALKPAAAALAPAPASKRSTRRLQSGYVDDDHAERRLFSGVSREYSFGSGGSSGEGPDIQRAISLAAAALRGITAAIDVAAAGKGGAPSRPLPIAGTAGMRTLAGPAGSSGGAASVGAARTRASEFSAGSGTLSSPSGGHSGSGGPPEVEGDTDPGAAAAAAGMEALLLPPQRRALMRRRARDMKESAERKRPAKSTSKSSGKGSVASVPGPGGGGAGHPPRPTRDASWSSRSTHVSALTVRSATAAYDASKVAGTVSGVPRRLGYSRRAPAEDSSTRSLPGAARADPSFATASAARLMASIARASSERHLPGVHPARGPALLTMDRRTWSAGSGESDYLGFSPSGPQRVGQSLRNLTDIAESVGTPLAVSPRSPR